jgi:hypothetical protein
MPIADTPQSNKQHAVPQNIMDVEFKLIGDLTMRQFSYLLLCGILAYLSFVVVVGIFKIPLGIIFILLGLGLAFVPLGERGLDDWIASFVRAINLPTQRIWKKEPEIPIAFSYQNINVIKQELITLAPTSSRRKLEQYLKNQVEEEKTDPLDIPEQEYIMKVRNAFSHVQTGVAPSYDRASIPVGVSVIEEPKISLELEPQSFPAQPETPVSEPPKKEEQPSKSEEAISEPEKILPTLGQGSQPTKAQGIVSGTFVGEKKPESKQGTIEPETPLIKPVPVIAPSKGPVRLLQEENLAPRKDYGFGMPSITPDMHSGRKFVNLLPSSGELILPIRGERVLRTSDQVVAEGDLKEKTDKLQELLVHIREKEGIRQPVTTPKPVVDKPVESIPQKHDAKVEERPEEKTQQQQSVSTVDKTFMEERQKRMEGRIEKTASGYSELERRYQQLQTELEQMKQSEVVSRATQLSYSPPVTRNSLTQSPDVLSGTVKSADGRLLPDVLIIVKNKKGEAVRAVKTNSMGQFILLTPLDKGVYTVELSSSNNLTETFDIIPVEVKGGVIPLTEFNGR